MYILPDSNLELVIFFLCELDGNWNCQYCRISAGNFIIKSDAPHCKYHKCFYVYKYVNQKGSVAVHTADTDFSVTTS